MLSVQQKLSSKYAGIRAADRLFQTRCRRTLARSHGQPEFAEWIESRQPRLVYRMGDFAVLFSS